MAGTAPRRATLELLFNSLVCCAGLVVATVAAVSAVSSGETVPPLLAVGGILLTVLVARFPVLFDRGEGGTVEIGFDSTVLIFMLCTLDESAALVVWSLGVLATQIASEKRVAAKLFNIGVGILGGAIAALILAATPKSDGLATAHELLAVAVAATAYFSTDLLLSAVSLTIRGGQFRNHVLQRQTVLAIACFVPFDMLGYLAAIVYRATPWWTLSLLCAPLVSLLVATRAVTRGEENSRRLSALFDAAVRAQTLTTRGEVEEALVDDARRLLRLPQVDVRPTPPGKGEIGAEVRGGKETTWLVAKALDRARSTSYADEQALKALAAVADEALSRLDLIEEKVHVARHDPLTDLPNRGILLDRVSRALEAAHADARWVALLFIDLDDFKPVNDRFGHDAGDAVLVELADRLRTAVGGAGTVARLGGDEFAVLFEDLPPREVETACEHLLAIIADDLHVGGSTFTIEASAGIAFAESDDTATGLVRKADLAMYAAKAKGEGGVEKYVRAMGQSRLERLDLIDDLRSAIAGGEINVVYQPIIAVETGRIVGAEALARWSRDGVPIPPDVFITAAEDAGLIVDLGDHVLRRVAADVATLRSHIDGPFLMTVNISARQLREATFVDSVRSAIAAMHGVTLVLEITERQGIDLDPIVLSRMEAICAAGARLAVDDFGVGFSSISYLHDLPVHYIKADAALAQDIAVDERARALLRSVIAMGRTLGLGVVIEGIESDDQLAALGNDTGELTAQGYLMYRPMVLDRLAATIAVDRDVNAQAPQDHRWRGVKALVEASA
ncbi:diguanylate cyclase (GGDEF) domain-containing protein [Nocardioides terrae]|uniref:Diguanylate cyclase (GGDEF) domain-containing protein n=1 Tax=Nocardioides terrae TaxID=574651 RepID=A0A1I1DXW7_9ACTN|nr:bifunctional diguanylate cyclase/phosphodiesterase [Nocardioides terrae]SFB79909.1 diguanylate cyclase (GGDEF) domain-containing protein [Nocardioides terrae]